MATRRRPADTEEMNVNAEAVQKGAENAQDGAEKETGVNTRQEENAAVAATDAAGQEKAETVGRVFAVCLYRPFPSGRLAEKERGADR